MLYTIHIRNILNNIAANARLRTYAAYVRTHTHMHVFITYICFYCTPRMPHIMIDDITYTMRGYVAFTK